jgi:hypothetical protein
LTFSLADRADASFKGKYFISLQQDYSDNIYLSSTNVQDDFIIRENMGFTLSKTMPRYDFSLNYDFKAKFYTKNSELNDERHAVIAESHMEVVKNLFFIDAEDRFATIPSDIRRPTLEGESESNMIGRNRINVSAYLKNDVSQRTSFKAGYRYSGTEYTGGEASDTNYNILFETIERRFSSKFASSIDYEYKQKSSDELTEEFQLHNASLTTILSSGSVLTLKLNAGNGWFDFTAREDEEHLFWNFDLKASFSDSEKITLHYGKAFDDSPERGLFMNEEAYISVIYGKKVSFNAKVITTTNDFVEIDRRDKVRTAELGASWKFMGIYTISADGYITNAEFSPENENVASWGTEFKASYHLSSRVKLEGRYKHSVRDSNVDTNSFVSNVYTLMLRADL